MFWGKGSVNIYWGLWPVCFKFSVWKKSISYLKRKQQKLVSYHCWGWKKFKFNNYFCRKKYVSYRFLHRSQPPKEYWPVPNISSMSIICNHFKIDLSWTNYIKSESRMLLMRILVAHTRSAVSGGHRVASTAGVRLCGFRGHQHRTLPTLRSTHRPHWPFLGQVGGRLEQLSHEVSGAELDVKVVNCCF